MSRFLIAALLALTVSFVLVSAGTEEKDTADEEVDLNTRSVDEYNDDFDGDIAESARAKRGLFRKKFRSFRNRGRSDSSGSRSDSSGSRSDSSGSRSYSRSDSDSKFGNRHGNRYGYRYRNRYGNRNRYGYGNRYGYNPYPYNSHYNGPYYGGRKY